MAGRIPIILIVDDAEPNRLVLSGYVDALGLHARQAENGRIALEMMQRENPDLVLLDILMPEMDGFETLRRIKLDSKLRHVPVIMISALDDLDSVVRCIEQGADDYLVKPFNPTLLRARVNSCLRKKEFHDAELEYSRRLAEANDRIQLQNEELTEANSLKDKFLQIASHDIRNPLTVLLTAVHVLKQAAAARADAKAAEYLEIMTSSLDRIQSIVDDFLDYRKLQSGNVELRLQELDIAAVVRQLAEECAAFAGGKKIVLGMEIGDALKPVVGDREKVLQIATNYLTNALKFSPRGSTVKLRCSSRDAFVRIEICDEGPGVKESERPQLFKEFAKISNKPTGSEKSTGLGLSIVKRLTEAQGGRVGADFPEGGGSAFWFELPTV
jgi:two-component system, sensor histidine kinase and response regulator